MKEIEVREANTDDTNFILSSWLRSYRVDSGFTRKINNDVYYFWHEKLVKRILSRPTTRTLVAVLREDPFVILGYLVVEFPDEIDTQVIHFTYVKKAWREIGIFNQMMKESNIDMLKRTEFTHHMGKEIEPYAEKHKLIYNPYLV